MFYLKTICIDLLNPFQWKTPYLISIRKRKREKEARERDKRETKKETKRRRLESKKKETKATPEQDKFISV